MKDQESVADYLNWLQVIINSLKACNEVISDQQIVEKVLRTLTPRFEHIVMAIEESKDLETWSWRNCKTLLRPMSRGSMRGMELRLKNKHWKPATNLKEERVITRRAKASGEGARTVVMEVANHTTIRIHNMVSHQIPSREITHMPKVIRRNLVRGRFNATIAPSGAILLMSAEVVRVESPNRMMRLIMQGMKDLIQRRSYSWWLPVQILILVAPIIWQVTKIDYLILMQVWKEKTSLLIIALFQQKEWAR